MEAVSVAPAPVAAPEKKKLLDLKEPLAAAAKASPAPAGKWAVKKKLVGGDAGYVLEDVPHLTDYLPELPTYPNPLQDNPAYSVVKQYFVNTDDTVTQKIVVHKTSARGTHFRRAGPRQRVYFQSDEVNAAIVTCGGLCPGLNTVIRELVCGLYDMYGVIDVVAVVAGDQGEAVAAGGPESSVLCVSKCGTCPTICTSSPPSIVPLTAPSPPSSLLPLSAPPPPYLELLLLPPPGDEYDLLPPPTPTTNPPQSPCPTPPSPSSSSSSEPPPSPPPPPKSSSGSSSSPPSAPSHFSSPPTPPSSSNPYYYLYLSGGGKTRGRASRAYAALIVAALLPVVTFFK